RRPRHREDPQPDICPHELRAAEGVAEDRPIEGADGPIAQEGLGGRRKVQASLPEEEAGAQDAPRGLQADIDVSGNRGGARDDLGIEAELVPRMESRLVQAQRQPSSCSCRSELGDPRPPLCTTLDPSILPSYPDRRLIYGINPCTRVVPPAVKARFIGC